MKKNITVLFFCFLFIFPACGKCSASSERAIFVTVLQDPQVLSSRKEIIQLVDFAKKTRTTTLFIQIYRANRAWFPSRVADSSPYQTCLRSVSEDPFALLIEEAHKRGIKVHAWINLLSLSTNRDAKILKKYGPEILTRNLKPKKKIEDYKIDKQYFLEPGDLRVRKELSTIVDEILSSYPGLDGLQFDYIRYPDRNPAYGYTKMNMERFRKRSGVKVIKNNSVLWQNWKRAQVTELLGELVKRARLRHPGIKVSTTGCAPYVRAYSEAFQDWPSWIKTGLVDFVTVMTYSDKIPEFERQIEEAKKKAVFTDKINFTIGAYKLKKYQEKFAEELDFCEKSGGAACVILGYGDLALNPSLSKVLTDKRKFSKNFTQSQRGN
ncbi:MAG: family 10 glycosylhydrolase [Candidatus Omnitrophica bacterium]|nr:family 10 glycosylhydrolase [Candidatus Omnitrophota bacterium]